MLPSEELDRRKKETQRLQDELENATKITLERFGCMYNNLGSPDSPGQGGYIHHFMECEYRYKITCISWKTNQQS